MSLKSQILKLNNLHYILFIVLTAAFFLRFSGLGDTTFYGDETKTFYLDKTVPAVKFLLDQRKGPVQFIVVWTTEQVIGGYDTFFTRLPFAWVGLLSIMVFYLVTEKLFEQKTALLATILFAFNGFFIAFSRTIQYQSFLVLFGLLAVYFVLLYYETETESRKHYLILGSVFLALTYLSHYDAVFFGAVVAFIFVKKIIKNKQALKEIILYFVIPSTAIAALFYVPYYLYGYYFLNTVNYVGRRLVGFGYEQNVSWYTFWVYNPSLIWPLLSLFFVPFLLRRSNWKRNMVLFWFLVPFVTFQFIFTTPGTHIINYLIPFFIIVALGIKELYKLLEKRIYRQVLLACLLFAFGAIFLADLYAFVPFFNRGYPWKDSINKDRHLFVYGFPYERGWEQISQYIEERGGVRKIYTNDNDTIAQYYLRGISYTEPGPNYLPPFYVHVFDNQEFVDVPVKFGDRTIENNYQVEKEFFVDGERTAILYKVRPR